MKKILVALGLVAAMCVVVACKEKRCECTTMRGGNYKPAVSLEPLGNHASCSELDAEWEASDSTHDRLKKTCVEYL